MATPSLHFLKKMDKAFCIVIDSHLRILKQCNGVAIETPFPFLTKMEERGGPPNTYYLVI